MRQAIHIFRKDVRHCWPYLAAVLSLTALNAWQASIDLPVPQTYRLFTNDSLLSLLMMLAWWLTIGAAVHGESLVGERQFWTTRPYSWKSLLAAKLLFLAAFMALPLLISDFYVLLASGFNPLDLIPGLLWRQAWLLAFLILPFVVAMLTRATHDFALAGLLSWLVFYVALSGLRPHFSNVLPGLVHAEPAWIDAAAPWLAPALGVPLIVWQFARRRTVMVMLLAIACFGLVPPGIGLWLRMDWPDAPHEDPRFRNVTARLSADAERATPARAESLEKYLTGRPLEFSGWPRELMTHPRVTVDPVWPVMKNVASFAYGPDNSRITTAGDGRDWIWFSTYDMAIKAEAWGKPDRVDVAVTIALDLYERESRAEIRPAGGWTRVPRYGNVKLIEAPFGGYFVSRTAIRPADSGWTYSLRDANGVIAGKATWSILLFDPSPSPVWFSASPVFSYAGQPILLPATMTGVQPAWGLAALHHDPSQRLVLTARHRVAELSRTLIVPKVRLADLAVRHH